MRRARTWGWTRTRLYHEPSNDLGPSSPRQSCPVCIIDTPGYDFREGQCHASHPTALLAVGLMKSKPRITDHVSSIAGQCRAARRLLCERVDVGRDVLRLAAR